VSWVGRPIITETLIPEQADEEPASEDEDNRTSLTDIVSNWVGKIFERGNKTEIEAVRACTAHVPGPESWPGPGLAALAGCPARPRPQMREWPVM
jgi:hypothetical protein